MAKPKYQMEQDHQKSAPAKACAGKKIQKWIAPLHESLKPRRALTAYNLFTGVERERILSGADKLGLPVTAEDVRRISLQHKEKKKRQHRKSHGIIGFQELSKTIAKRWKELPDSLRKVFEEQAELEKLERKAKLQEWRAVERRANQAGSAVTNLKICAASDIVATAVMDLEKNPLNDGNNVRSLFTSANIETLTQMRKIVDGKLTALMEVSKLIDDCLNVAESSQTYEVSVMDEDDFVSLFQQSEEQTSMDYMDDGTGRLLVDHCISPVTLDVDSESSESDSGLSSAEEDADEMLACLGHVP